MGEGSCEPCPVGTFKEEASSSKRCQPCATSHVAASKGSSACTACGENETHNHSHRKCVCAQGHHRSGDQCLPCEPGTFSATTGDGPCTLCPQNHIGTVKGSSSELDCVACQANETPVHNRCVCVAGFHRAGECVPCSPDFFKPYSGDEACYACPAGWAGRGTFCDPERSEKCRFVKRTDFKGADIVGDGTESLEEAEAACDKSSSCAGVTRSLETGEWFLFATHDGQSSEDWESFLCEK